jgi:uncharacterized protein (TIGR02186 family)
VKRIAGALALLLAVSLPGASAPAQSPPTPVQTFEEVALAPPALAPVPVPHTQGLLVQSPPPLPEAPAPMLPALPLPPAPVPAPAAPTLEAPAPATPRPALVAELSQARVDITTGFTGTELLVFGATDRLIGPQPGAGHGDDVLIVAQNAPQPMVVRRKIRVLGFWINGPSARFRSVPGVYLLTGTRPLRDMLSADERTTKRLGLENLPLDSTGIQDPSYRQALLQLKQDAHLWLEADTPLRIAGARLFSARLPLPATVQTGDYRVEVMLVRDSRVLARQELSFRVERVGTAAGIADVARQQPLVYGLICILLAAFAGWMGSVLFRRS